MDIKFDQPAFDHIFTLKCFPQTDALQQIGKLKIDIFPNQSTMKSGDAFGNMCITGHALNSHDRFSIDVLGEASVGKKQEKQMQDACKLGFYKYSSKMTKPNQTLIDYFSAFEFASSFSNFDKALLMMNKLHQDFIYEKGATNVETTAQEAFDLGRGVCQDYSHILISLCRLAGIATRYVAGLLLEENFTHAWIEILQIDENNQNQGYWIAVDPTNNLIVDDQHIKFSSGRDSKDCLINHGIFTGGGNQTQNISISVSETQTS